MERGLRELALAAPVVAFAREQALAENHLEALFLHAPELMVEVVLADPAVVTDRRSLEQVCESVGARLVVSSVSSSTQPEVHDELRLAAAYRDVLG